VDYGPAPGTAAPELLQLLPIGHSDAIYLQDGVTARPPSLPGGRWPLRAMICSEATGRLIGWLVRA